MTEISGEEIAGEILAELEKTEASPKLGIILVGDKEPSRTFVQEKIETAEKIGFETRLEKFDEEVQEEKIIETVEKLNQNDETHGILVQLPLPGHINENKVFETLKPEKDVDGLTPLNLGKTLRGNPEILPGAVKGIEKILEKQLDPDDFEGLEVTVINNSNLIGKPLSMILSSKGATVTICNRHTEDLEKFTREADAVITATGVRGLLKPEMVSENSIVIDAGYSLGKGDIEEKKKFSQKTVFCGVPGGVGPLTVAFTMKNLLKCYRDL